MRESSRPVLLIFIDGLRHEAPLSLALEALGLERMAFVPPLGFSANILPLLYRGRTPDELGFYNEYGIARRPRHRWLRRLDPLVESVSRVEVARKVVYKLASRAGLAPANIPFRYLPYFEKQSESPYTTGTGAPSLLEEFGFELVLASRISARPPARDRAALAEAAQRVPTDRLYISLNDLDAVSHAAGLGSSEYAAHEALLREGIERLVDAFRKQHGPDSAVCVLGDHGMAPVRFTLPLRIEDALGPAGPESYLYFTDSTFVRVWCFDDALLPRIERYFASLGEVGREVTPEERRRWGIVSREFGTHIYALEEGAIFSPNFIGRGEPLAMHGYHPKHPSQHAAFLSSRPLPSDPSRIEGAEAYHALRALISG